MNLSASEVSLAAETLGSRPVERRKNSEAFAVLSLFPLFFELKQQEIATLTLFAARLSGKIKPAHCACSLVIFSMSSQYRKPRALSN
jgi:hypothetical protein